MIIAIVGAGLMHFVMEFNHVYRQGVFEINICVLAHASTQSMGEQVCQGIVIVAQMVGKRSSVLASIGLFWRDLLIRGWKRNEMRGVGDKQCNEGERVREKSEGGRQRD